MSTDPSQSEVDAVALAIAIDMRKCGGPSNSEEVAKWSGVQREARAAIRALDRVRAEQHKDDCEMCYGIGQRRDGSGEITYAVRCAWCLGTGKRAPGAKGG